MNSISRRSLGRLTAVAGGAALLSACTTPARTDATPPRSPQHQLGPIKQIKAGLLDVGYTEAGPADGRPVILLHGWPYDIHSYADVSAILAGQGFRVIVPYLRGFGSTRFLSTDTFRNGQQAALGADVIALMDALRIDTAILGGYDWGGRTANVVASLWPQRVAGLVAVSGYIVVDLAANREPLPPEAEHGWWYQYYFATPRGELGYRRNTTAFNRLIWSSASPLWQFDDAAYDRSATAFDNPDHVDIVIHNYRWRLGLAAGESRYDADEQRLAGKPRITAPAITIASDFDGAAKDGTAYRDIYTGPYQHRVLNRIGHNVPQEAPAEFAAAVVDVDRMINH
ncbi:alpha/beta fold hydrolase [Mycolicibacterium aichiense]|uniref:Hydrolase, alpha/beta fold protein n=1 Tax=Mycolicibacterium aichiense TaxID=1799 RepID=A0AAD1MCG5_9MYCO|nr:alpha/beta hydrolase [Mycolicibacterium aichiense]MCV7018993.1 alpha/beta hydrolase [Mycolicibacterium aichiense]BBX08463.1 putative hydrolase, alpha/beta fold protein [Mycolicibacterium aichiense]STZ82260.1 alpha/beta hydrolase fold protein [Mycolicibacterium aichiense]